MSIWHGVWSDLGFGIADLGKHEAWSQTTEDNWQQAASSGQLICHMPSASLGHYAPLSLGIEHGAWGIVVIRY